MDIPNIDDLLQQEFPDDNYTTADCHIFVAGSDPMTDLIATTEKPIFVAVNGVPQETDLPLDIQAKEGDVIHAIYDWWRDVFSVGFDTIADVVQIGSRSVWDDSQDEKFKEPEGYVNPPLLPSGRVPNQLKNGDFAFLGLFQERPVVTGNEVIKNLDVSNLTTMNSMLCFTLINPDISSWDVSNVTDMTGIFGSATAFNQDISGWNTSNVENMTWMFDDATSFNQDLSQWCVSKIDEMPENFDTGATAWKLSKPNWGSCPRMEVIPEGYSIEDCHIFVAGSNGTIYLPIGYDEKPIFLAINEVPQETDLPLKIEAEEGDVIHAIFDWWRDVVDTTPNVIDDIIQIGSRSVWDDSQNEKFKYPEGYVDPPLLPSGRVPNQLKGGWFAFFGMFQGRPVVTGNEVIKNLDVSNLTQMNVMFTVTHINPDISGWDISNVTNMDYMFSEAFDFNQDISNWDTSKVTNMGGMFADATSFNQDLYQWCVSQFDEMPEDFDTGATAWEGGDATRPDWGKCLRGEDQPPSGKVYLGDVPLFDDGRQPIFIDDDGKKYYEEDCHIFVANENNVYLSIPNGTNPIFVSVDKEKKNYYEVKGKPFNGSTIHAIFDWDNSIGNATQQNWISNILQLGSRSVGDEPEGYENPPALPSGRIPNQLKSGKSAFYRMKANPAVISNLDVSNVTDMMRMFYESNFNSNISKWDTSKVTTMYYMFYEATAFNQDISKWNTSNVEDMGYMFNGAIKFNKDISGWDTSNVEIMRGMFQKATDFDQDISKWNTSNVNNMIGMFMDAKSFNQPLSDWDTSNVTSMASMFRSATNFNSDISKWDTSNVTSMYYMFGGFNFNQPISEWNTSNVEDMSYMFSYNREFNQDISKWNTSKVTNMKQMFDRAFVFTSDISKWDTSKVEDMTKMFYQAGKFNADLSQWCVSKIPYAPERFDEQTFAWTLPKPVWGTCPPIDDILPEGYVTKDCHIFIANGDWIGFPCSGSPIFVAVNGVAQTTNLTTRTIEREEIGVDGVKTTTSEEVQVAAITANDGDTIHAIFDWYNGSYRLQNWFSDIIQFGYNSDTKERNQLKNGNNAFYGMTANPAIISTLDTSNVTDMSGMFQEAVNFNQPISNWNTSNVTNMGYMFRDANSFNQPLSGWDTSKVEDMNYMFNKASVFKSNISKWNTSNVTDMSFMFQNASDFNSDISEWITSKVTNMTYMFANSSFNQDISGWDVSNVENMGYMFNGAESFNSDISEWITSKVTDMSRMFWDASNFKSDISKWDTSNVTSMNGMLSYAPNFKSDISEWITSKVTNMAAMFNGAASFNSDISGWDTSKVRSMTGMFDGATDFNQDLSQWCVSLIKIRPTQFDNGATAWQLPRPVWGTCPRGEDKG